MNGARNLACGSPSAAAETGEVNSWPTSESLLHSRRCELLFEISIFYAYTWEICRRPARRYRRATQFRLVQRRRRYMYVHLYECTRECTQSRALTFAEGQKRELFLFLSTQFSATALLTPVEFLSRADIIVPRSGESRSLCAVPVHAFGKWPPILSRDSSPSKWSPLDLSPAVLLTIVLSRGTVTVEDARGTPSKGDGIITWISPQGMTCRRARSRKESSKSHLTSPQRASRSHSAINY